MTLPAMLSTLRDHEARTGAVVVPKQYRFRESGGFYDDDTYIRTTAAELILLGCMAKWLNERGVCIRWNHRKRSVWQANDKPGVVWRNLDATDCLSAHFSACLARLADMPAKEGC